MLRASYLGRVLGWPLLEIVRTERPCTAQDMRGEGTALEIHPEWVASAQAGVLLRPSGNGA